MYNCRILTWEEIASVYDSYMKHDFPSDELKPLSMKKNRWIRMIISLLEHIPTSVDISPCLFVASDSTKFTKSFRVATV